MKRLFARRAICDHPPVARRVIRVAPTFLISSSTWRVLSGDATDQRTPVRIISCGTWAPLKLLAIVAPPPCSPRVPRGDHTSHGLNEHCDRTVFRINRSRVDIPTYLTTTESMVNQVISKRFCKKQQMAWTPRGAHLLLQIRTRVLNGDCEATFREWYLESVPPLNRWRRDPPEANTLLRGRGGRGWHSRDHCPAGAAMGLHLLHRQPYRRQDRAPGGGEEPDAVRAGAGRQESDDRARLSQPRSGRAPHHLRALSQLRTHLHRPRPRPRVARRQGGLRAGT